LGEPRGTAGAALERLRRRADFLRAAKGKRFHARGLTLQAAPRSIGQEQLVNGSARDEWAGAGDIPPSFEPPPRFGFTITKRLGGAVRRNRIRRRLKEALRLLKPLPARRGYDYVIVARPEALGMSFRCLQSELMRALGKLDARKNPPSIRPDHGRADTVFASEEEASRKSSKGRTPKG